MTDVVNSHGINHFRTRSPNLLVQVVVRTAKISYAIRRRGVEEAGHSSEEASGPLFDAVSHRDHVTLRLQVADSDLWKN